MIGRLYEGLQSRSLQDKVNIILVSDHGKQSLLHDLRYSRGRDLKPLRAYCLNAVYLRRGLTCTLEFTNDLIDGGQPRAKPHLRKAKPNHVLNKRL